MKNATIITIVSLIYVLSLANLFGQNQSNIVVTTDIDNFWNAYDKIVEEKSYEKQLEHINNLYINKGTSGLKAIMQARRYSDKSYVDAINSYPKYWKSIRSSTYKAKDFGKEIQSGIKKIRKIYPEIRPAKVYFTIGAFRTNGTTMNGMVLIGSELALANDTVITSEFPDSFSGLMPYLRSNPSKEIVFLTIHEFIHTQQKTAIDTELLTQCLREGIAEFITVKTINEISPTPSIARGKLAPVKTKTRFRKRCFHIFTIIGYGTILKTNSKPAIWVIT